MTWCCILTSASPRPRFGRSHKDLAHEIDDLGATPTVNSSREQLLMS
jgi:hypothetical protein